MTPAILRHVPGLTPPQKIRLAHDAVHRMHPICLAAVAAQWRILPDTRIPTFCTNGKTLRYNPAWVETLTLGQVACIVLHETCHVALGHTFRLGQLVKAGLCQTAVTQAIATRFNIATDLAINSRLMPEYLALCPRAELDDLVTKGTFPRHGGFPDMPGLKSAEWYYAQLQKDEADRQPPPPPKSTPQPGGSGGSGDENGEGKPEPGEEEGKAAPGDDRGQGDTPSAQGEGENEGDAEDPTTPGNVFGSIEPYATDPEELEQGEREFRQCVTVAIVTDKSWGTTGGWLETELSELIHPTDPDAEKLDWKTQLREFLTKICRTGFSYARPSRRHGHRTDLLLPARRGTGTANGVLVVDTSGSMGDAECNVALRELEAILASFPKATVRLLSCDTKVMDGPTFTRSDFPLTQPVAWQGRGGTDLTPAFRWVADQPRHTFDWCICLTDMEWYWQAAPNPGVPAIFLACRPDTRAREGALPFGKYLEVKV